MLEGSRPQNDLANARSRLVKFLMDRVGSDLLFNEIREKMAFSSMNDSGMGSFQTTDHGTSQSKFSVINCKYIDADGILVLISMFTDDVGYPLEVDFWKTDFSALQKFPSANEVFDICITK